MTASDCTTQLDTCGCFPADRTPLGIYNRPGLQALAYRIGTHPTFLRSMLARLPSQLVPPADPHGSRPLTALTTRRSDDPTIALLDAWAVVADVLTFYQERIANEGFLRTATERRSVLELARAIGYELRPGVAANTILVFTVDDTPGAPGLATIDIGTRVQSVPGQNESTQIFETIEKLEARAQWNALRPKTTGLKVPRFSDVSTYLKGTSTNLKPGDWLLLVGKERERDPGSERWDCRMVTKVEPDYAAGRTLVTWDRELGKAEPHVEPASNPKVFALRQRAAVFGHNAPDWRATPSSMKANYLGLEDPLELMDEEKAVWPAFTIFAPTSQRKSGAVPDREVQPTRESVAAAATAAANAAATNAANDAVAAAQAAAQSAADAAQKAVEKAQKIADAISGLVSSAAKDAVEEAVSGVKDALESGTNMLKATQTVLDNAANDIQPSSYQRPDSLPSLDELWKIFQQGFDDARTKIRERKDTQGIDDDVLTAAKGALDTAKTDAGDAAKAIVDDIQTGSGTIATELTDLGNAVGVFARKAGEAAKAAAAAAGATQEATIIVTLVEAALHPPPPAQPPADAARMADLAGKFADAAVVATAATGVAATAALMTAVVAAGPGYAVAFSPIVAGIAVTGMAGTIGAVDGAMKVRDTVKTAVDTNHALKTNTLPRPARRDTFDPSSDTIDLDAIYPQVTPGSWLVLSTPEYQELYLVKSVAETSRADFSLTAKTTRVTLEGENLKEKFEKATRTATVFAQSEELDLAEGPLLTPVAGDNIALGQQVDGLATGRLLIVSGKDSISGKSATEVVTLLKTGLDGNLTKLYLNETLAHSYGRDSVAIYANVARATHGETTPQVLGSGNGAEGNQHFVLKKPPLTYLLAPPSGARSTLSVRVNGVLWEEAPFLYGLDEHSQSYIVRQDDSGKASVIFGDGQSGARLPSGIENVAAVYRSGIGPDGEVDAGSLTTLLTRPLGVREVTNPLPAANAAPPEVLDDARANAPLTVLTLERIVSLRDFEDFARAFPGMGKARAEALWNGESRVVHITVAPSSGGQINIKSDLYIALVNAINAGRDPVQPVEVAGYQPRTFSLEARILVDPRYLPEDVLAKVLETLRAVFAFQKRSFGQPVSAAEVVAVIHGVEGVVAVGLDQLAYDPETDWSLQVETIFRPKKAASPGDSCQKLRPIQRDVRIDWGLFDTLGGAHMPVQPEAVLLAHLARGEQGKIRPAELLLINPAGIRLKKMAL